MHCLTRQALTGEIKVTKFIKILLASITCCGFTGTLMAAGNDAATPDEVVLKVGAAAKYLNAKGSSGFSAFNDTTGPWTWKDSYVFVYDCRKDRMIAHPFRPDLVGRPIMQIQDNSGKFIFKELCKAGQNPHGGWVEYSWPKPGAGNLSRKLSYSLAADISFSTGVQVGAGIYDDSTTTADLSKLLERHFDPAKVRAF